MQVLSYDRVSGTLDVALTSRHEFFDIPATLYDAMMTAESPLNYFNAHIWNKGFEHRTHWPSLRHLLRYMEEYMSFEPPVTVDSKWPESDTPLHVACIWGDVQAVDLLLVGGANPNARGDLSCTPLYYAVAFEHVRCAERLIEAGATADDENELGTSARKRALESKKPSLVDLFRN
jgi:hypothetical protein